MKLVQIYSNKQIKPIRFSDELNVVIAKVTEPTNLEKTSHNLGKSTLIELIDFLLLKEVNRDKEHFLVRNNIKFREHIFFLELKANSGKYVTVRRAVETNTKVSFRIHDQEGINLTESVEWTQADLTITKAKEYLNSVLALDALGGYSYRDATSYFLRNQYDYQDIFQLSKNDRAKDIEWKPILFHLFNFPDRLLIDKYQLEDEIGRDVELVKTLESRNTFSEEETDKIRGIIQIKDAERSRLRNELDQFKFILSENKVKKELVDEIEEGLSRLNSRDYELSMEAARIEKSQSQQVGFDLDETAKLFAEFNIHFQAALKKSYEDLLRFNREVTQERHQLLSTRLRSVVRERRDISRQIVELNEKRSSLLSFLRSEDTFSKFKEYQKQVEAFSNEIFELENQLKNIGLIDKINADIENKLHRKAQLRKDLQEAISTETNLVYADIRNLFGRIVRDVLGSPAVLSLRLNKNGNVDFRADIQNADHLDITDKAKGTTFKKILCVAFDLSLLIAYSKGSFFRFVYHDGVFEGLDNRMKKRFLATIKGILKEVDIQYIFTAIEDDLPKDEKVDIRELPGVNVAVELDDSGPKGKLFLFEY